MRIGKGLLLAGIAVAVLNLTAGIAAAVPVAGEEFQLRQPDRSTVAVRIWGDEFYQVVESLDGRTLVRDPKTGVICYARLSADGRELESTGLSASQPFPANKSLELHLRISQESVKEKVRAARTRLVQRRPVIEKSSAAVQPAPPSSGNVKGICLIVDFSDDPGTVTPAEVNNFCNQRGYASNGNNGSVFDFFNDVSGGRLNYTNHVPAAYYRAKHPKTYYDNPLEDAGPKAEELVLEALNALNAAGFNFGEYDSNGDGMIDAINCFYAGGCDSGWAMGLWPHSGGLTFSADGVEGLNYQITYMGGSLRIGTFCHENGHMICWWPDLYDYDYSSNGIGRYCLMGSGSHAGDGLNPIEPCPYMKDRSGWATLTLLTTPQEGLTVNATGNRYFKYANPTAPNEYYLISNIQQTGRNAEMLDAGLALWHIDTEGSNNDDQMTPEEHFLVTLVQADGYWDLEHGYNYGDADDLFDALSNDTCAPWTYPNTNWWSGEASGLVIRSISASGPAMTFTYERPYLSITPSEEFTATGQQGGPFSPSGNTYTITNNTAAAVNWTVSVTAPWLSLSTSGGSLAAGAATTVTASINAAANALPGGAHLDSIVFHDTVHAQTQRRGVMLKVRAMDSFAWDSVGLTQTKGAPFSVGLKAVDALESTVLGFSGTASLAAYAGLDRTIGENIGNYNASIPMACDHQAARTQALYPPEEIGGAGTLTSLALYVHRAPGIPMKRWTVRLKHTALTDLETVAWEGSGWTTVFQNDQEITAKDGWARFDFTAPFNYDGVSNLLVDFSFSNASVSTYGFCGYYEPAGANRCIFGVSDGGAGDPLTWSGFGGAPAVAAYIVPDIRIRLGSLVSVTPALSGNFASGRWTGTVRIDQEAEKIYLRASTDKYAGESNVFAVAPARKVTGVTSGHSDGVFGLGERIGVLVTFSGPVTVTGTPGVYLETGDTDRLAAYESGSGTSTLLFRYTVAAGDASADLDYRDAAALVLNGGAINNPSGNGAVELALPEPGAEGSLGANKAIAIDTEAPNPPAVFGPASPTGNTRPTWSWNSGGGGAKLYRFGFIEGQWLGENVSTTSYSPAAALTGGSYTLHVQERDTAANWSISGTFAVTVDATPPDPPNVSGTASPTSSVRPTWTWSSGGGGGAGMYRYGFSQGVWTAENVSHTSYTPAANMGEGTYTLYVQERDAVGNWSVSQFYAVQVDLTPPGPPEVTGIPSPTSIRRPAWSWTSGGGSGNYRYGYGEGSWIVADVTSQSFTPAVDLAEGPHTLFVQERDAARNWSVSSKSTVVIDATAPEATLTSESAAEVKAAISVTVELSEPALNLTAQALQVTNAVAEQFYSVDNRSTFTLRPVREGAFSVQIPEGQFNDKAGNPNRPSNLLSRRYDTTVPAAPVITTDGGHGPGQDFETDASAAALQGTAPADAARILVNGSETGVTVAAGSGAWQFAGPLAYGANRLEVVVEDLAGNRSAPDRVKITRIPPQELHVSGTGDDAANTGAPDAPWRTIAHAMDIIRPFADAQRPFTIHLAPGTYAERVAMEPYCALVGGGTSRDATRIAPTSAQLQGSDGAFVIAAAAAARLENLVLDLPADAPSGTVALRARQADCRAVNIAVYGRGLSGSVGVEMAGAAASKSVITGSLISRTDYGLRVTDAAPTLFRNEFRDIRVDAVLVQASKAAVAAVPVLGDLNRPGDTGANLFSRVTGMFVRNTATPTVFAQMNNWSLDAEADIAAKMAGPVTFVPFLRGAASDAAVLCAVTAAGTGAPLQNATLLSDAPGVGPAVTGADGKCVLSPLPPGNVAVSVLAEGYAAGPQSVALAAGELKTLSFVMAPVAPPASLNEAAAQLSEAFTAADTDANGALSRSETIAARPGVTQTQFEALDTDGSGGLTRDELDLAGAPSGCAGCSGAKSGFTLDSLKRRLADFFLAGLALTAMLAAGGIKPRL